MRKHRLKSLLCSIIIFSAIANSALNTCFAAASPLVGITQIVPHPALALIRNGIEDELEEHKVPCLIQFENAQGNIATSTLIAQKFVRQNPAVIVPITTHSAQTVYSAVGSQKIPVVFAAVSDPVAAGLTSEPSQPGKRITGVCDYPPMAEQIALIQLILPQARIIGTVYNPGESNSVSLLERFEGALKEEGMVLVKAPAPDTGTVTSATKSLIGKVDALYITNDNTVVSAVEGLLKVARENSIAVFCSDLPSVKRGCLGAVAHNQYSLGHQTGKMVAKILAGADIQSLPVETPDLPAEISINQEVAKNLAIVIPENLAEAVQARKEAGEKEKSQIKLTP